MARSSSSSRFVSVNLSKSYGQPPSQLSGHGSSVFSASGSSSSAYRTRAQSGHSGMVVLSRPGRSQSSVSSTTSRTSKLAVPSPVNLPSRRREHAGNDPTIALVGTSGSTGWSKQQVSALPVDGVMSVQSVPNESAAVRSTPVAPESRWSSPVSQVRVTEQQESFPQVGMPFYQASTGKLPLYMSPGSRNANALKTVQGQSSERAMIVRGEEFPTLQAAARPLVVPALQRQKEVQQKQQDKQHEIRDQHSKVQQLSQQLYSKAEDSQAEHRTGPQLQPVRPQASSKQPVGRERHLFEMGRTTELQGGNLYGGPSPLTRLNHTSNWADDERETLQSVRPQALMQSDRSDSSRPRNGYHLSDSWGLDHKGATDSGRPLSGFGGDLRNSQDRDRNVGSSLEVRSARDMGSGYGITKGLSSKQFEGDSWEDIESWSRGPGRNDSVKRDWSSPAKEMNHNRDARLGNPGRSFNTRNMEPITETNMGARRDVDLPYRGNNMPAREVHSRDGSNRLNAYTSKQGVNDRLGDRSRKSAANYQAGHASLGRLHSDLSGLDYGREKRVPVLHGHNPFLEDSLSSKPSSSLVLEAFMGMSGLEGKMFRRKKDESQTFRDPARELFEAELERVQKMQEQERQRLVEDRERAIELARKEEEERERLAKEEEFLRLKLEEEAIETAAQAQRASEEAARKTEELRRAREEQKRMVIVEEERRKEAARRKLLDLEQRIAQRECLQQQTNFLAPDASTVSIEMSRRLEEDERALPKLSKIDSNEEHALGRGTLQAQALAKKESWENFRPLPLDSTVRLPADSRRGEGISGDKNRVVQMKRRENLDNGPGFPMALKKYHLRDDTSWMEPERDYRGLPLPDYSTGPNRSFRSGASQASSQAHREERVLTDPFTRKEHWKSGHNERFLGEPIFTDINAGYIDPVSERENDGWWGRDNHRRLQQGQRLNSPPLPFHMNGAESDYPSYGRLRQSLPKQPRVPLPIFGRPTSHKQVIQSEIEPSLSSLNPNDESKTPHKNTTNSSGEDVISENNQDAVDHVDNMFMEASVVDNTTSTVPIEDLGPALLLKKASDEIDLAGLTTGSQKDQTLQPDEIDQLSEQLSELTESEDRLVEDEKQLAGHVQVMGTTESADDEDGWLVQAREEDMGEEMCIDKYENEVAIEGDSDDQEWESSRVPDGITPTNIEHGTGSEEDKGDEVTWETQHVEDEGDGVVDDPERAADVQWESNEIMPAMTERQSDTELKDSGVQDSVKDHVVQLQNVLSYANAFNCAQAEGHSHGQSFLQHFQQPFSFMAVPLSQSTALNGVTSHPPMVPSMHGLHTHQELPYHLQMGLLPGTPLMPNAIQIGSIQMPLQVHHPQISPVAHLHHQQPPVFQFGQLCPFSQPLPPMQPAVQVHHAMGQPSSAHHHQTEFLSPAGAQFSKFDGAIKKLEEIAVQGSFGVSVSSEDISASSVLGGRLSSVEHIGGDSALGSNAPVQNNVISEETGLNAVALQGAADASSEVNRDTSVGKIIGGRRRNNSARSAGVYGRGRGRSHFGKNHDYKGPYSAPERWPESIGNEGVQSRTHRQTYRRAEYKVRKPIVNSETDSELSVHQGNHVSSYVKDGNASDGLKISGFSSGADTLPYLHSQSLEGSGTQHTEALPSMQPQHAEFRRVQTDVDNLGEASLQSGVAFDFEEQGNEAQIDKDGDFIEVRSKRQLLREQRELRDKAKTRELKVKEQAARRQQKVVGKSGLPEGGVKERWSGFNADAATNEGQAVKQPSAMIGSGLPTAAPSESKASKSGQQYQPLALAHHSDSGNGHAFEHQYRNEALGTTMAINAAWGVQRSSREVVSLTQIQLEEALKPFGVDGISTQMTPIPERGPSVLEQGISRASCSVDKVSAPVKASVSMPGPISSLLAGEKIQFGAVTSPTIVSSASHPPSPSYVGAIGSQFVADTANFSSHPLNKARNYFGQDKNGSFLSSKVITRAEDDVRRQLADSEAEAEAAASAVAVAAISNDDALGNQTDASIMVGGEAPVGPFASYSTSSALEDTGCGLIHAPSNTVGVDDSISVALPADLSLETPAPLLQVSLPGHPVASELTMQSLPSRASAFPCLDMGTILGGPIFAYGPRDDAPFEPGFASIGAGSVAGWQHRHPNASDSFYGAPPPFVGPTGLPSIQGHPHMLVYTNPFTPVGQFGQLGVSFMGTAYHPSGKQPDWTHTPYTTSPGPLNQSGGDVNAVMMDPQHSVASNSPQAISVAGCSMMPVPSPMSLFDPNFSSPFQAQWSRAPSPPFSNYHVSGPAPSHNLQSRFPGELEISQQQSMHMRGNSHRLPEMGRLQMSGNAADAPGVHFSEELGLPYFVNPSNTALNNMEFLANGGIPTGEIPCNNLQHGQIIPQSIQSNLSTVSLSTRDSGTQDAMGVSQLEASSQVQGSDLEQHRTLGHLPTTTPLMDKRVPPQTQARGSSVVDYQRRGSSRSISTVSPAERGPASTMKPKQIYVAKPATPIRVMDAT